MADSTTPQEQQSDSSSDYESDPLVKDFIKEYPIPLQCLPIHHVFKNAYVFWSENEPTQYNPSSDDHGLVPDSPDTNEIHQKLKSVLGWLLGYDDVVIQFWSIEKTGSRCLLTTKYQPFSLTLDSGIQKYRLSSIEYKYNIDPNNLEVEDDSFIINGAPANVFQSHLLEVIIDLRVHQGSPLVDRALECGLMSCFFIPICDASQSHCVGVLECCAKDFDELFGTLYICHNRLKDVGLTKLTQQKDMLYKSISGLKVSDDEIKEALIELCESHKLTLAQVSIAHEDENLMKRIVALTLITVIDEECYDYCDGVDMNPVKITEGLAGKALENYEPHFCRNIYAMSNIEQLATAITMEKSSYLVVCLKSISTGDRVDYVFEFLWPREQGYVTMIQKLLLTLKEYLPNFKFSCGAQLGDELRVIEVGKFSESGIRSTLEFFKGEKLSPITKLFEEGRKRNDGKGKTHEIVISLSEFEQQYGRTMEEAATNLGVSKSTFKRKWQALKIGSWPGPKGGKRKVKDLYKDQSDMNEGDNRVTLAPLAANVEPVTIIAEYQNDPIKFYLPLTLVTLEAVEKEIGETFKLDAGSFKLKYRDENGEWFLLVSNHMKFCIKSSTSLTGTTIRLRAERRSVSNHIN